MKNIFAVVAVILSLSSISSAASAAPSTCYQVSSDGVNWSRTPESLCISETENGDFNLSLRSGLSFNEKEIAHFNLSLLQQARCLDCNANVYGVAYPSNSAFENFSIRFDGKITPQAHEESGNVFIGQTKLFYRNYPHHGA